MKHLILLLGFLVSQGVYGQNAGEVAVAANETLMIENYSITNEMFAYAKSGNSPVHGIKITLKGEPASNGSSVSSAEINFFNSGDPRLNQKPTFDNNNKRILAYYPIEAFSGVLEMLKMKQRKKTTLTFDYSFDPSKNSIRVYFNFKEGN